jgi:hypothetical protein
MVCPETVATSGENEAGNVAYPIDKEGVLSVLGGCRLSSTGLADRSREYGATSV